MTGDEVFTAVMALLVVCFLVAAYITFAVEDEQ